MIGPVISFLFIIHDIEITIFNGFIYIYIWTPKSIRPSVLGHKYNTYYHHHHKPSCLGAPIKRSSCDSWFHGRADRKQRKPQEVDKNLIESWANEFEREMSSRDGQKRNGWKRWAFNIDISDYKETAKKRIPSGLSQSALHNHKR